MTYVPLHPTLKTKGTGSIPCPYSFNALTEVSASLRFVVSLTWIYVVIEIEIHIGGVVEIVLESKNIIASSSRVLLKDNALRCRKLRVGVVPTYSYGRRFDMKILGRQNLQKILIVMFHFGHLKRSCFKPEFERSEHVRLRKNLAIGSFQTSVVD